MQMAQLAAQARVSRALGDGFIVALNLAPTTPDMAVGSRCPADEAGPGPVRRRALQAGSGRGCCGGAAYGELRERQYVKRARCGKRAFAAS